MDAIEKLTYFLRPPGLGVPIKSTGANISEKIHQAIFGTTVFNTVDKKWKNSFKTLTTAKKIIVGIPSDIGAGILRGANMGPVGIRSAFFKKYKCYPEDTLDLGDVLCIPQLLHDEMLNDQQISAVRRSIYPNIQETFPVSPLSIAEEVFSTIHELNPKARLIVLGGDHSVSWPAILFAYKKCGKNFGILHFDAHPDLIEHRFGIKYCFTTWAYHAANLLKPQNMIQVGIRTTKKTKEFWMEQSPVQQIWAKEIFGKERKITKKIVDHFKSQGVKDIYISNDIDGSDSKFAPATGTPEEKGLKPKFILELIQEVSQKFNIIGADIVEVAPPLSGKKDFSKEKTCLLAAQYLRSVL